MVLFQEIVISSHFDFDKAKKKPPEVNSYGISKGWYLFPINFDPTWQTSECESYAVEINPEYYIQKFHPLLELFSLLR